MKIIKGDKVLVISGKNKGKIGKITKSLPSVFRVVVEGVNVRKKHIRPKKEGQKGQVIQISVPLDVSSVKFICPKCEKASRVGYKVLDGSSGGDAGQKIRFCKKCGGDI